MRSKVITGSVLVGVIFLVVTGCGSFNNSFNRNVLPPKPPLSALNPEEPDSLTKSQPATSATGEKTVTPNSGKACELDPYVQLPPAPEIPTKEFQAAVDIVDLEKVERKHIRDLRSYIAEVLRLQQKNQMAFYEKCNVTSK